MARGKKRIDNEALDKIAIEDAQRGEEYYWSDESLALETQLARKQPTTRDTLDVFRKTYQKGALSGRVPKKILDRIETMDTKDWEL